MDWQSLSETAKQFIASDLFRVMVAGAFGAFFGAWGAQRAINRNQTKQAVVTELNSVRAALMLCYSICNQFAALKKQQVLPLRNRYVEARQAHDEFLKAAKTHIGPPPLVYELRADLQTITPVWIG